MKATLTIVAIVVALGCSEASPPTAPGASPGPPHAANTLWVMVVDSTGSCIVGATVHVVQGQRAGSALTQDEPCGYWDYGGGVIFRDLTPNVDMTLRAAATGYVAQETTVAPKSGPLHVTLFTMAPAAAE